jgi:hypothetical protein
MSTSLVLARNGKQQREVGRIPLEPLINLVTRARRSCNRPSHNYKVEDLEFGQTWGNGSPEGLNDELFALFCDFSVESHSDRELRGAIAVGERKDIKRGNLGNALGRFKQHFGYCLWKRLVGRLDACPGCSHRAPNAIGWGDQSSGSFQPLWTSAFHGAL